MSQLNPVGASSPGVWMWLRGGVEAGVGEQKIPDFEAEERLGNF